MSIPSPLRIPCSELGKADDQRMVDAFLQWRQREWWAMGGSKPVTQQFGLLMGFGAFALFYLTQAVVDGKLRTIRVFRNTDTMDEPARWSTVDQFKPLPPVKPVYNWFPPAQWWNNVQAARQTALNDTRRFVDLPWGPGFVTPPVPDPQQADNGFLVDDTRNGIPGWETLGLRPVSDLTRAAINLRAGQTVCYPGDWVVDGMVRRTAANLGKFEGRGCGKLSKRAGVVAPQDFLTGWDESKAAVFPNIMFGPGAWAQPGYRVEHTQSKQRHPDDNYPMGDNPTKMIAHGTRIRCTRSRNTGPNSIERWADDQGFTGPFRAAAIKGAEGCCEFGVTACETGRGRAGIESTGRYNPEHAEVFDQIGVSTPDDGWRMFNGLFTLGTTEVCNPAALTVANIR